MWRKFSEDLRFETDRVLREQLKLVFSGSVSTNLGYVLLTLLITAAYINDQNAVAFIIWASLHLLARLFTTTIARRALSDGDLIENPRAYARKAVTMFGVHGFGWGALAWLVMDTSNPVGTLVVLALMLGVIAIVVGQTMALFAAFVAFSIPLLLQMGVKLLMMGGTYFTTLSIAALLLFFTIMPLARNNARAASSAIHLRFENEELIEMLRIQSHQAETARAEAEQANDAKSKFLAAASHDLRQPIHALNLFISVLEGTELDEKQRTVLSHIRHSTDASSEMLNTLLNFSRLEAGVIKPHPEPTPLKPLLQKLENELQPVANDKGITYRTRPAELRVHTDPALLELILRNLVTNAIRYTESGGILVGCRRRGDRAIIEVWDTGIGIDPAQQRAIFKEFHQLGNPERDSRKGLGLGLAICDGLAHNLGHRLSVSSVPNRGSVFRLELLLAKARVADQIVIEDSQATELLVPHLRVLIIDDNEEARNAMRALLTSWQCDCNVAEGLEEALEIAEQHPPQLVISDYRLRHHQTGSNAIVALRNLIDPSLPAILVTGDTAPERIREAEKSGVPLLHKPISTEQLRKVINDIMSQANLSA